MATTPGANVSGDKVWSDRKEVEESGNITAVSIQKTSGGTFIGKIRIR